MNCSALIPLPNPIILVHVFFEHVIVCVGESRTDKIQENVLKAAGGNMSVFCLGFGDGVDYGFLDVMAKQNSGVARRIYEASDAVLQLKVRL